MRRMLCAAAVAAMTMPVSAGEPVNWTGFYVGAHAGHGWSTWDGPLSYDDAHLAPKLEFDDSSKSIDGDSWLGGLQIGANYQSGTWVYGIEADVSWTDMTGSGSFLPYPDNLGSPAWDIKTTMDMFGTVRGRLGLTNGPLLVYATGGLAWANVESSIQPMYVTGSNGYATSDETHIGYTVGAGMEWMLARNWSLKAEYLYADLGKEDYAYEGETKGGGAYDTDHHHADLDLHTVRLGLNYAFR